MRWFAFFIILLVTTLLEASNLLNVVPMGGWYIGPDLLITLLVYYAIACRPQEAVSCCFLIGIAADLAAGSLGPHMICYGVLGTILNPIGRNLTVRNTIQQAFYVFFAYLVTEIIAYWLNLIKTHEVKPDIYSICLLTAIFSAMISPLVWSILSTFSGWSGLNNSSSKRSYY